MSEEWVLNRLNDLSPSERAQIRRAIRTGDVDFVITKVDTTGSVSTFYAKEITDSTGKVVKVKPEGIWP